MRQLFPEYRDHVDPAEIYDDPVRTRPRDRPHVFVNMIASLDGGTVVNGVTEQLGSEGDRQIFRLLRSMADGILVGAGTIRAEGYGVPALRPELSAARAARGQHGLPRMVVVTRSLDVDYTSSLFTDERSRPFVLAPAGADPARLDIARQHADVIAVGAPQLDLDAALRRLAGAGVHALLCEGGPTLNGALLAGGLIDELCLTVSPNLVGGDGGSRIMGGASVPHMVGMRLHAVLEEEGFLFLRYVAPTSG